MKVTTPCSLFVSAVFAIAFCAVPLYALAAPAATTTTLAISSGGNAVASGGSVASGSLVTLTAVVSSGSTNLTVGQVNFCDASASYCTDIHLLGTAQLTSAGTAVLRLRPGIGSHSYKAIFAGTPNGATACAGSTSSITTLTVTGTFQTTTTIAASGSAGNYTLTANVTALVNSTSLTAQTGAVSFIDTTNNNLSLGTATLGAGATNLSFVKSSSPNTLAWPQSVAVADFNGDGNLDLAIPSYGVSSSSSDVSILLGNGDGTFTDAPATTTAGQLANNAAVADFNGDGNADLALSFPDANQIQVLLGHGDGTFAALTPINAGEVYAVAAADLNGDGKADLIAIICATNSLSILLGNGDGTFRQGSTPNVGGCPSSVAVGDFNGDGIPDLAVVITPTTEATTGSVVILLGNGDGTFTQTVDNQTTGDNPLSIVAGDFNGDGILDLAVANTFVDSGKPGTVTVLLGKGDGTFSSTVASPVVGSLPYSIAVGDFNGDGIADLVTSNTGSNSETVLLGKGDGTFIIAASPTVGATPNVSAVGDFNGDGLSDVAAANNDASSVTVLLAQMSETATATATGVAPIGTGTHQVEASYPGNSIFEPSVSPTTALTATGFAITSTAVSVVPGATVGNTSTITLASSGNFAGNIALTAVLTSSPTGALYLPTFSFGSTSPVTITGNGNGTATLTITTTAAASAALTRPNSPSVPWYAPGGAVLACILLFCVPSRRRSLYRVLGMLMLLVALAGGVSACGSSSAGSSSGGSSNQGTTPGNYTVTVTGTSNAVTATGTVTLTVQ